VAYPSRLLNEGERVVVTTRTHVKALLLPALLLLLIAAATGFVLSFLPDAGRAQPLLQAVVGGIALLGVLWLVVRPFLVWLSTSYTFTDRRFITRSGLVSHRGRTIPLNRISGVDYDIGIVDRVFGCGTLVVSDASEAGRVELHDIPQVERVQMQVSEELHRLSQQGVDDGT
jgi:uncharacterized membrane protein YdbT with pleckstrin-like domain